MSVTIDYLLYPIGFIQSTIKNRSAAAKQGYEGAPDAWLIINEAAIAALEGTATGDEIILMLSKSEDA